MRSNVASLLKYFAGPAPVSHILSLLSLYALNMWPISLAWVLGSAAVSMRGIGGMSDEKC